MRLVLRSLKVADEPVLGCVYTDPNCSLCMHLLSFPSLFLLVTAPCEACYCSKSVPLSVVNTEVFRPVPLFPHLQPLDWEAMMCCFC